MKGRWRIIKKYSPWLTVLLSMDVFFCLLLWVVDVKILLVLTTILTLSSILLFAGVTAIICGREARRKDVFKEFLASPDEANEEALAALYSQADRDLITLLGRELRKQGMEKQKLLTRACDYEEYVESWAHETKIPISLLTMLLDNRRADIPENVCMKLDYIRNRMQEYVEQMLFYARLKGEKKDYLLEEIDLQECVRDVLEDYAPLLLEQHFQVKLLLSEDDSVFSDRRGLRFLLNQIVSNSVKYARDAETPQLRIFYEENAVRSLSDKKAVRGGILTFSDNGIGVRPSDLPYIFEKGFTGDTGENRKRATGMGLYLSKEIAVDLGLTLSADSQWGNGFKMTIFFPEKR